MSAGDHDHPSVVEQGGCVKRAAHIHRIGESKTSSRGVVEFGRLGIGRRRLASGDQDEVILHECSGVTLPRYRHRTNGCEGVSRRIKDFGRVQVIRVQAATREENRPIWQKSVGMLISSDSHVAYRGEGM